MSSTTSSSGYEYYDDELYRPEYNYMREDQCDRMMETVPPNLCCNTMGHPLVYYAQVPPPGVRSPKREQRKIKNYFVKAFKWYTEERPPENKRIRSAEFHGFAAWLDRKFSEYLRETEQEQSLYHQQYGTPINTATGPGCCRTKVPSTMAKRFARFRSPCVVSRCKKAAGNDTVTTTNGSCQFILHPKDLTRPVSECCYPSIAVCPNITKSRIPSTETENTMKLKGKSQSMTSVCRERAVKDFIDMMVVPEGPIATEVAKYVAPCHEKCKTVENIIQQRCPNIATNKADDRIPYGTKQKIISDIDCKCPTYTDVPICDCVQPSNPNKSKRLSKCSKADVSCQCPEESITKFDVSTQYNQSDFETITTCWNTNLACQKLEPISKCNVLDTKCSIVTNVLEEKATRSLSTFTNDGAQTSDHSIHIETGNGHELSFYMKIICADKFNGFGCS